MRQSVLVALACLVHAGWCQAETDEPRPKPLELGWAAPGNCPQELEVQKAILALVGAALETSPPSRLRARGRIEQVADRYRLTLTIEYGSTKGVRVMDAVACSDLGGAAAVALGLLVRTEQTSGAPLTEQELGGLSVVPPTSRTDPVSPNALTSSAVVPRATVVPSIEPTSPTPEPATDRVTATQPAAVGRKYWFVRTPMFAMETNSLPDPSYGVGAGAGRYAAHWRLLGTAILWLPRTRPLPGFSGVGAWFLRATLEVSGCRGWDWGKVEISPCLTLAVDGMAAHATGTMVESQSTSAFWFSPGGALTGHWHIHQSWALTLALHGRVATSRPQFVVTGTDKVARIQPATFAFILGGEWIL